jgi:hypothetical protein
MEYGPLMRSLQTFAPLEQRSFESIAREIGANSEPAMLLKDIGQINAPSVGSKAGAFGLQRPSRIVRLN